MPPLSKTLLFILFFCVAGHRIICQGNQKIDSLVNELQGAEKDSTQIKILIQLFDLTVNNDIDQARQYCRQMISISQNTDHPEGLAQGYKRLGITYLYTADYDSSNYYYHKALEIYEQENNINLAGVIYFNLALNFFEQSMYDSALKYNNIATQKFVESDDTLKLASTYDLQSSIENEKGNYRLSLNWALKALKIFEKYGDQLRSADTYVKIGDSYEETSEFELSKENYENALEIYENENDRYGAGMVLSNLGQIYIRKEKFDSATILLKKSLTIHEKLGTTRYIVEVTSNLGLLYFIRENYSTALEWFEKSNELAKDIRFDLLISSNLIYIGNCQIYLNQPGEARKNLEEGLKLAHHTNSKENLRQGYWAMSELYEALNDHKKALEYYKKYKEVIDSIYNIESSRQMSEWQTIYETEKKEQEIALQKREIELLNLEAQARKMKMSLMILGFVALIIIVVLIISNINQQYKRKLLISEQEKLDYEKELNFKKKELTVHTLHLVQKNELLENLREQLSEIKKNATVNKNSIGKLIQRIKSDKQAEHDWEHFQKYFKQVHENFDNKLRAHFNDLTTNEIRLAALLKMSLSTKEIASILNISPDSVNKARYRLRKKLNLSSEDSLHDFILAL